MYFLINLTKRSVMFTSNKCFYEMKKKSTVNEKNEIHRKLSEKNEKHYT